MNKKIKKYLDEIAKTEKKIADLQQYLRGVQAALKQEEDNEMIRCIRGMKMDNDQLYDLFIQTFTSLRSPLSGSLPKHMKCCCQ